MPLLTEQELERIAEDTRQEIAGECGRLGLDDVEALIASHRELGALIKELAEALRHADRAIEKLHVANGTGHDGDEESGEHYEDCLSCEADAARSHVEAALSKVPR